MADLIQFLMHLVGLAVLLSVYFLPAIIAARRNHPERNVILVLNWWLGWTGAGWIAALVWSVSAEDGIHASHALLESHESA